VNLRVYYKLEPLSLHEKAFMPVENPKLINYDQENFTKIKRLISTFLVDKNFGNEWDLPMLQDPSNIYISELDEGFSLCIKLKISTESVVLIDLVTHDLVGEQVKRCDCQEFTAFPNKEHPFSLILG
jgi:hypothetical protein